jgi:hypothetical protein
MSEQMSSGTSFGGTNARCYGSAFTARRFRARLGELGIKHRLGGYRDPESQAFIESWFGELKEREVWLDEYETLDDARRGIGGYVDRYHHRPHSRLGYKTPYEVGDRCRALGRDGGTTLDTRERPRLRCCATSEKVERIGIEPMTSALQRRRSPS